jgi:hypothetical protein
MLTVKVTNLEPLESDLINLANISFRICIGLDVIETSRISAVREACIDMKMLEDSVLRVMIMNGEDLFGSISFDKDTDFSECVAQELS